MSNRLINEQSPYLLQHAHNPVDWYPWGDEAFDLARTAHKPVIVSIGYAACHWCHVMERESFEDPAIAAFMNEHFVCIKVDREEHPDVDHLYMDAVQAITGSGGWPLNAFVTPDRIPFYGGTYFPPSPAFNRPSWMQLLQRMSDIWNGEQGEVSGQADQMLQYLQKAAEVSMKTEGHWDEKVCAQLADNLLAMGDKEWGGFGNAPKFPGTMAINFLLERYHFYKDEAALDQALLSLDAMIAGGIYDQLNGGFARYSTDRYWLAPHFEKMLYDNALLVLTLCNAYQVTGNEEYRTVIEETLAFAERELKHPEGGYYSALDADSEGVEGKFYTWTWDEWQELFPGGNPVGEAFSAIQEGGNWEHTNIIHRAKSVPEIAAAMNLTEHDVAQQIRTTKEALLNDQKKRVRPSTDDKCLLSWNALMNLALSRAGIALQRTDYLEKAAAHMEWMTGTFMVSGRLMHTWKAGPARIAAKLDDYAYLIQAMLQLGSTLADNKLLFEAKAMTEMLLAHFDTPQRVFFYFTSDEQTDIPVRKTDVYDGATPSPNAVMAHNLLLLGLIMENHEWLERSRHMCDTISATAVRYPYSFGYWATLLQQQLAGHKTAVIAGNEAVDRHKEFQSYFLPHIFIVRSGSDQVSLPLETGKKTEGNTLIFLCSGYECLEPESSVQGALAHANAVINA